MSAAILTMVAMVAFAIAAGLGGYFLAKKLLFSKHKTVQAADNDDDEDEDEDDDEEEEEEGECMQGGDEDHAGDKREDPDEYTERSQIGSTNRC